MPIWGYFHNICDSRFICTISRAMLIRVPTSWNHTCEWCSSVLDSTYCRTNCREAMKIQHFGPNSFHNLRIYFLFNSWWYWMCYFKSVIVFSSKLHFNIIFLRDLLPSFTYRLSGIVSPSFWHILFHQSASPFFWLKLHCFDGYPWLYLKSWKDQNW